MLITLKDGRAIACGQATKNGGELKYIGDRQTPKLEFSLRVENTKDASGEWQSKFLNCCVFGQDAESAPAIAGKDKVLAVGTIKRRSWTGRDGEPRISEELNCDFISVQSAGSAAAAAPPPKPAPSAPTFTEFEDDGELPF